MKNPLNKRLPRELKQDIGKYIAIFFFITVTIGFVSGFLVADSSMKTAYDNSFEKYSIEDGHFELSSKAQKKLIDDLEAKNIAVHENFYVEKQVRGDNTLRIFKNRDKVNLIDVMKGSLPQNNSEIAIDRLYANNNNISIKDHIFIDGKNYSVCGFVSFSDYSALFKNNTDMMFDAQKFSVAVVSDDVFLSFPETQMHYCYTWLDCVKDLTENEKADKADEIVSVIAKQAQIKDFVKRSDNQAIQFTGDDMGSDKAMMTWMLYIVIVVLAFIFAVTTKSTIEQEAFAIGTLRASGYKKDELLRHYIALPLMATFTAAVIGNILGYTLFKQVVAAMYYGCYSLPRYETIWNADAFIMTTLIPCIIILIVNLMVLVKTLSLPPLSFLRRELTKRRKKRVIRLKRGAFIRRFRIRIITQNIPTYITMFIGILLANVLLIFGMIMSPLLEHYKADVIENQIANYQYILKSPVETADKSAEKYCVKSMDISKNNEEVLVYGIAENSKYLTDITLPSTGNLVIASDGYMKKYDLHTGDTLRLKEPYKNKIYTFTIAGSYHYPAGLSMFMTNAQFSRIFDTEPGYFTGYFSKEALEDINEDYIASTITQHDLIIVTEQLDDSMGRILPLFGGFSVFLFILIIYLLSKLIIDKNAFAISMVKILGYNNREIGKLYSMSTAIVVGISLIASIPVSYSVMKLIYAQVMQKFNGYLDYYVDPSIYPTMLLLGVVSYAFVSFLQSRRIKKVSMSQALKNME